MLLVNMESILVLQGELTVGVMIDGPYAPNLAGTVRLWS
jgi:hypothetical protein